MSKNKKKKWWQGTDYDDDPIEEDLDLYSNTVAQHSRKLGQGGYSYDYEDTMESPYKFDWGLERKLTEDSHDGKKSQEFARTDFQNYNRGGVWQGYEYYKKPELSYKYVQQMANALAAQHKITVKVGSNWTVDLKNKTLTYNPASLIYGTKSELLATLMHEIGKLRYSAHPDELKDKYLAVYGMPAIEILSIFEDVRVDYLMLKAYEGAGEIYDSAIPAVDKKIREYKKMSQYFTEIIISSVEKLFTQIFSDSAENKRNNSEFDETKYTEEALYTIFGEKNHDKVKESIEKLREIYTETGNVYDYAGEILRIMYDTDSKETEFLNIQEKVALTEKSIDKVKKLTTAQATVEHLSNNVYPVIEGLLRDFNRDNEKIKELFPNITNAALEHIEKQINSLMGRSSMGEGRVNTTRDGNSTVRSSGPTDNIIPYEWTTGEYNPIKESVMPEIKSLIRQLTFLRREELSKKYQGEQRRGILNAKKLYRSATGNRRVFKKILPNSNTVQSFAFSLLVDTSGSMAGPRMVHTTRALTIFTEVFKKMDIPFEIIPFANNPKILKGFDTAMTKKLESKIGGLVNNADGGTNLHRALEHINLEQQPQTNKVCVVLTDGGVGSTRMFDDDYFKPMAKKGILSVGFGIECEEQMKDLCMGNSKVLDSASSLPTEFSNLLKSLIRKK